MNAKPGTLPRIYLIRHGETAWSLSGQHTRRTDPALTERGEQDARQLAKQLGAAGFSRVFTSPLLRARRTSELAGLSDAAEIEVDAVEWDYGDYEGWRPAMNGRTGISLGDARVAKRWRRLQSARIG